MTDATTLPVLDLNVLIAMYGDDSADTIILALSGFRNEANIYISQLKQALITQDYTEIARLSHSLKSMSGLIGACQLMTLCQTTEQTARQGDLVTLRLCTQELASVWPLLLQQLQISLQQYGHSDA